MDEESYNSVNMYRSQQRQQRYEQNKTKLVHSWWWINNERTRRKRLRKPIGINKLKRNNSLDKQAKNHLFYLKYIQFLFVFWFFIFDFRCAFASTKINGVHEIFHRDTLRTHSNIFILLLLRSHSYQVEWIVNTHALQLMKNESCTQNRMSYDLSKVIRCLLFWLYFTMDIFSFLLCLSLSLFLFAFVLCFLLSFSFFPAVVLAEGWGITTNCSVCHVMIAFAPMFTR